MKMIARFMAERGSKIGVSKFLCHCLCFDAVLTSLQDTGTINGQPVCLGNIRKPASDAAFDFGRSQLVISLDIITAWGPGFVTIDEQGLCYDIFAHETPLHDNRSRRDHVGSLFDLRGQW